MALSSGFRRTPHKAGVKVRATKGRDDDGNGDGHSELLVEDARDAADEGDRDENRGQDSSRGDNRPLDFFHGRFRRVLGRQFILGHMLFDVFDDDDGVVDDQADGQDHGEKGQGVDGEIEDLKGRKGPDDRNRHGQDRDERRPPFLQEDEDDEDDQEQRFDKGIFDFVQRVNLNACNKKNMECLALAGGFDSFPELKREQYFAVNSKGEVFLETLMRYGNRYQEDKRAAINSLFGGANVVDIATPEIPQGVERWGDLERLNKERDLVGIYLSAHPLDEFAIVLDHVCNTRMADLEDKAALAGREITMGGIVTSVRRGVSKNGNPYGIAKIEDYSGSTEIPFWGNDWVTYQGYLNEGTFLYIKARCQAKQWRQDELEVKITSMELLPDVKEELVQKITIVIPLSVLNSALVTELATLTKEHPGNTELYFKVTDDADVTHMSVDLISRPVRLSVGRDLITYLKERPELGFHIN